MMKRKQRPKTGAAGKLKMRKVGHRGRMRDHAVLLHKLLREHRRIALVKIIDELGISETTARRWIDAFSSVMPIRVEGGVVITDQEQ